MDARVTFRVEPAAERDVPVLLRMIEGLAAFEDLAAQVAATEAGLRDALFGNDPTVAAVVAFAGEEAVGMAIYNQTYSTFLGRPGLYVEDLFVEEPWRGRGAGKALMTHLARLAVERGCARLDWAVLNWNERAIRFYRSLGAKSVDQWTVYRLAGDALASLAAEDATS